MSIEKITSKIISDAESEAGVIFDETKSQCDAILAKASEDADKIEKEAAEKGANDKEKLISRRKAVAEIDGRKIVLEQKQKLISECFDKAVDKITGEDKAKYTDFIIKTVKDTGITAGEIFLNDKDAKEIGAQLIEKISAEIPESKITLSKETRNIKGGFLLRNGSVYINGSIEALLEESRDELVAEVAKQLFE